MSIEDTRAPTFDTGDTLLDDIVVDTFDELRHALASAADDTSAGATAVRTPGRTT